MRKSDRLLLEATIATLKGSEAFFAGDRRREKRLVERSLRCLEEAMNIRDTDADTEDDTDTDTDTEVSDG
jgi:hypothetical protein